MGKAGGMQPRHRPSQRQGFWELYKHRMENSASASSKANNNNNNNNNDNDNDNQTNSNENRLDGNIMDAPLSREGILEALHLYSILKGFGMKMELILPTALQHDIEPFIQAKDSNFYRHKVSTLLQTIQNFKLDVVNSSPSSPPISISTATGQHHYHCHSHRQKYLVRSQSKTLTTTSAPVQGEGHPIANDTAANKGSRTVPEQSGTLSEPKQAEINIEEKEKEKEKEEASKDNNSNSNNGNENVLKEKE
ncbi:Ras guanine nucleotide exchange factor [Reticulomyxa filosa]|uniref:Ras guanine nucleotide exchange factor n=1 Tax=Reticulomyxa filosa TaxID=46433 RepID=X6LEA0_RETFI|nr:Ras guanine nucleotide exchange factor [Reticulomyxa filosa]|eukprot:ETO00328.1 Ras guanine nucleotide exchange factor [Reticulomyxa filosa]